MISRIGFAVIASSIALTASCMPEPDHTRGVWADGSTEAAPGASPDAVLDHRLRYGIFDHHYYATGGSGDPADMASRPDRPRPPLGGQTGRIPEAGGLAASAGALR